MPDDGKAPSWDSQYWEERYRGPGGPRRSEPHPQLVAQTAGLAPGRALDAGCGEGDAARWLAVRGWRVTAVDIAAAALARAREHAADLEPGVADRIDWVQADLTTWSPEDQAYDLVCAFFVHPAGSAQDLVRRLASAVAPGGTLLVVGHDPSDHGDAAAHGGAASGPQAAASGGAPGGHGAEAGAHAAAPEHGTEHGTAHGAEHGTEHGTEHGGSGTAPGAPGAPGTASHVHGGDDPAVIGHRPAPGSHVRAQQLAAALNSATWDVAVAATVTSTTNHVGRAITTRDAVVRAVRRAVRG